MTIAADDILWPSVISSRDSSTVQWLRPVIAPDEASISTVLRDATINPWLRPLIYDIISRAVSGRNVARSAVVRCIIWLMKLPPGIPRPFFAIGDDSSIGLEWERAGSYLYVVFGRAIDQVYFEGSNGDEWESDLESATDKLSHAIRMIAAS